MKTVIITENQRGILYKNGKYEKLLKAGKYRLYGGRTVEVYDIGCKAVDSSVINTLSADPEAACELAVVEVKDMQVALHYVNGAFRGGLKAGKHAFWAANDSHEFRIVDITNPEVSEDIPKYIFAAMNPSLFYEFAVADHEVGLLYYGGKFVKELSAGTHYFWDNGTKITCDTVDTRIRSMEINGQSVLTKDKVELRLTFMLTFKVTDCIKAAVEIEDFKKQLYTTAQLALRSLVGGYKFDDLLENREQVEHAAAEILTEKAKELYVEIVSAGIRDIILPGEISSIMNSVLAAEKRAQANVITRREEVASTRSLLNTAKLMDENQTLYKLKELEYIERICENVGNITLESGNGLLSQLATVLSNK